MAPTQGTFSRFMQELARFLWMGDNTAPAELLEQERMRLRGMFEELLAHGPGRTRPRRRATDRGTERRREHE